MGILAWFRRKGRGGALRRPEGGAPVPGRVVIPQQTDATRAADNAADGPADEGPGDGPGGDGPRPSERR